MEADTVIVKPLDGTSMWTWVRHIRAAGDTEGTVYGVPSPFPYPDSASALEHAKAVNADLTDSAAFTIENNAA